MNFNCNKCQTRYTIADEKLRGKVLKIRCRSCSALITVRDPATVQPGRRSGFGSGMYRSALAPQGGPVRRSASSDSIRAVGRRVARPISDAHAARGARSGRWGSGAGIPGQVAPGAVARKRGAPRAPGIPPVVAPRIARPVKAEPDRFAEARKHRWFLSVEAGELGPISFQELRERLAAEEADRYSFGWREGLPDWKLLGEIDDLEALFSSPSTEPLVADVSPGMQALASPIGGATAREEVGVGDFEELVGEATVVVDPSQLEAFLGAPPEAEHEIVEEEEADSLSALASEAGEQPVADDSVGQVVGSPAAGQPLAMARPSGAQPADDVPTMQQGSAPAVLVEVEQPPADGDLAELAERVAALRGAPAPPAIPAVPSGDSSPAPLQPVLEPSIPPMSAPVDAVSVVALEPRKAKTGLWVVLAAVLGAAITASALIFVFVSTDLFGGSDSDSDRKVASRGDDDDRDRDDDDNGGDDEVETSSPAIGEGPVGGPAMIFAPDVITGSAAPRTGKPRIPGEGKTSGPDYASIYASSSGKGGTPAPLGKAGPKRASIGNVEISGVVEKNRKAVKLCYERALKKGEGEGGGKATVTVTVRGSGDVTKVAVAPPYGAGWFGRCLKDTISRWKFPAFSGAPVTFKWPIILESGV